ncbi:MAG: DNA mismatch repair protein MutS [candidate division Zixibacteria bacterium SM23_73]|nr:MAG: DNA mismatch repair protein MutS [candidate division Zixibacteria bacterium SM23_73]
MAEEITPLMNQYFKIKSQYPDEILFFRMGDFYEMFGEDAKVASKILGIALTSRGHIKGEKIPLAGIPYHAADRYLAKLLRAGKKVVVCEQVEDPKSRSAGGIVKRDVVEIITPGTVTVDGVIEGTSNNYLVSLTGDKEKLGLAMIDLTTGEFKVDQGEAGKINEKIKVLNPAEIICPEIWGEERKKELGFSDENVTLTNLEMWKFDYDFALKILTEHFKVTSLDGFGCQDLKLGISAAGAILAYLKQTKKTFLSHINKISPSIEGEEMFLDTNTIRNLELLSAMGTGERTNTLFSLLNKTKTAMGARLLKSWIIAPLLNVNRITQRQDTIEELFKNHDLSDSLEKKIKRIADLERLSGKIGYGKANPKDLIWLKDSLSVIPDLRLILSDAKSDLLNHINENLPDTTGLVNLTERSIVDEPPFILTEGGIIKSGYSSELDSLKSQIKGSKDWIAGLQAQERKRTGIPSLKVGFNKVFGYFIEVTKPHLSKVPPEYIRKQTMVNAERFVTQELKEKEAHILGAEEKIFKLEYDLFLEIRSKIAEKTADIQRTAQLVAQLDVMLSLKEVAAKYNYVRPQIDSSDEIIIKEGRHPVIENILDPGTFVPNDTKIDTPNEQIHIITGPNMAGKSTYLRQVGLIVLLAQMGSFVPAKKAKIGVVDRIFTRVGAMDYLALGQSTFLVEMNETANILNNATPKSLILLDEVGRGTSTFDGLSIAWAVTEHIHNNPKIGSKTLFATHFHELTELAKFLPRVRNYNVAVKEWGDEVIFLRKIVPGGCDDSYGIQVARLAGVPKQVLERAKEILAELENGELRQQRVPEAKPRPISYQLSIFSPKDTQIVEELKKLDLEKLTPIEALNKLNELKKRAEEQ